MTWGGYARKEESKLETLDLTKPSEPEYFDDPAEKARAEAEHWANVEADEQDRQNMLANPPKFRVVSYPAGDFLCLPDEGDKKGEMIPRAHIEKVDFRRDGESPYVGRAPIIHVDKSDNKYDRQTAEIYNKPIPPWEGRIKRLIWAAQPAQLRIVMSSGREITFKASRHYPEITLAALTKAWREQKAEKP